ncbi:MAG: hypothetical protein Q4D26_08435, partial [Clostridia bacterium]|nr:hypothetical protein [Clostridia bacterium]
MRRIKGILSKILFIVIFLECLGGSNTLALAGELDNISLFEMEVNKADENLSSGAVYIEQAVIENESGTIDEYVESILTGHTYYSELTESEKITVRQNAGLREDTMTALCDKGYTIEESRKKAVIMQQMNISVRDVLSMIEAYGSEEKAGREALKYRRSQYEYTDFYNVYTESDITALMIRGYEFEEAVNICVVKNCLVLPDETASGTGLAVMDIAVSDSAVSVSDNGLRDMAEMYSVNPIVLGDMLSRINMTVDEFEIKVMEYKAEHGMLPSYEVMAASSDDSEDDVFSRFCADPRLNSAPFTKDKNVLDSVSICSGALTYTDKVTAIPGINGMDFDLNLIYNSDDRILDGGKDTDVWSFNIPRFEWTGGERCLHMPDGNKYTIKTVNHLASPDTYVFSSNYYRDMQFEQDEEASVLNSKFKLSLKEGKAVYFDKDWNAIRMEDRFGNYINISRNNGMEIKSSSGINADITYESVSDKNEIMTVRVYNSEKTIKTIKYSMSKYYYSKYDYFRNITDKTDEMGNVTKFSYSVNSGYIVGKDNYHTINLTEIKFPSGVTAYYTYGKGKYVDWKTIDKAGNFGTNTYKEREYDRITKVSYYENGSSLYSASYTYSEHNYMCYVDQDEDEEYDRNYEYHVIKNENGMCTKYVFNSSNQLSKEIAGGYDKKGNFVGTQTTVNYYGPKEKIYDGIEFVLYASSDVPVQVTVTRGGSTYKYFYEYDSGKDLTGYWGPKTTAGQYSVRDNDTLHKVSYKYGAYSQLLTKSCKQDENTTITWQNTLTGDKKNIAQSRISSDRDGLLANDDYAYDARGNMVRDAKYKGTSGSYEFIYYTYDSRGQYVTQVKQNDITQKMEYDSMGNVTKATDGNGNSVTYTYDLYGNQTGTNDGKYTTRTVYNYAGNDVTCYDENNKAKLYDYNGLGQLVSVKDVSANKVLASYTYDPATLLMTRAVLGGKSRLDISYNSMGEICKRSIYDNNNGTLTYEETYSRSFYNGYQETETVITGGTNSPEIKNVSRLDYDGFEIYTKKNGVETDNTYDLSGNCLTSTTDGCTVTMAYNGMGQMTKLTKPKGGVYTYKYDTLGRNTQITAPNGGITRYTYDDSNRLIDEKTPLNDNSTGYGHKTYTYDNNNNVTKETVRTSGSAERATEYFYDTRNNLIKVQNTDINNNKCYTEYEYDGAGNMLKMKAANGANVTSYTYNSLNQLIKMTDPMGFTESYTYDLNGNMLTKKDKNGTVLKYDYDAM